MVSLLLLQIPRIFPLPLLILLQIPSSSHASLLPILQIPLSSSSKSAVVCHPSSSSASLFLLLVLLLQIRRCRSRLRCFWRTSSAGVAASITHLLRTSSSISNHQIRSAPLLLWRITELEIVVRKSEIGMKNARAEEAHQFWVRKIGHHLQPVPWQLCSLMISIYYRDSKFENLVKLFKSLEAFGRKPPDKSVMQKVVNAYEILGMLEEREGDAEVQWHFKPD